MNAPQCFADTLSRRHGIQHAAPAVWMVPGLLSSEDMVDSAYDGFIGLMDLVPSERGLLALDASNQQTMRQQKRAPMGSAWRALADGLYFVGSPRYAWSGRFDTSVDSLPGSGCVCIPRMFDDAHGEIKADFAYASIERVERFPKHVYMLPANIAARYRFSVFNLFRGERLDALKDRRQRHHGASDNTVMSSTFWLGVRRDGTLCGGLDTRQRGARLLTNEMWWSVFMGGVALNVLADRRYLWNVASIEPCQLGRVHSELTLNFGIDAEYVKSLCYARSLPLTPTGRRRPILHWVKAHKRRMAAGIDVDVHKHLRGVDAFEMGGLGFRITEPTKGNK